MISHAHKTIFIHIPKAAGQSVEEAFLADLNLDWDDRAELLLKKNTDPKKGPQRLAHLYAREYVELGHIDQETYDAYTTFAVIRHPYDRVCSEYTYRPYRKTGPFWLFLLRPYKNDFVDMVRHMVPQSRFIFDTEGKSLVKNIIRFENIADEIDSLFEDIFGKKTLLPRRNIRKTHRKPLRSKLTRWHKKRIYKLHKEDFDHFGYDREF
ncbi:sulfotransferase family 2 domain-containing protein [Pacificibacter sp. AS14]|uniref:sulfotransferase family 2 domain-containing protein n=1 Tax=Alphaproteobacteria TaxID=28211 RepID=UPI003180BCBA